MDVAACRIEVDAAKINSLDVDKDDQNEPSDPQRSHSCPHRARYR